MVDQLEFIWTLFFALVHLFHLLKKAFFMALCSINSVPLSWKLFSESQILVPKKARDVYQSGAFRPGLEEVLPEKVEGREAPLVKKLRKRPARIVIPVSGDLGDGEPFLSKGEKVVREMEAQGRGYCVVSKTGTRHMMEDSYMVIADIHGDSNQAFFGVFDGHGGRAAVDYVSEMLGKNIISAIEEVKEDEEESLELAIKAGYLNTDNEFLSKGVSSGACAATVLLKNGKLHVSNAGDCRVVMSRNGVADALTTDHRPGREDERIRIENQGGYVSCHSGVWRVQDSLAISRAIGDLNMKEWVISEPHTKRLPLTQGCEFIIMASDGLWDKVSNQEAIDLVMKKNKSYLQACKDLVEISCKRGNRDDITVMVVDLQTFCIAE